MQDIFVSFSERTFMLMILVHVEYDLNMDKKYLLEVIKLSGQVVTRKLKRLPENIYKDANPDTIVDRTRISIFKIVSPNSGRDGFL